MCIYNVNCFVCFFIYYMCDGSIASIASPIISLVTGKNEYEINARGVEGCLHPLPLFRTVSYLCKILLENFPKYRSVSQSRFTQQAVVVSTCESDHF